MPPLDEGGHGETSNQARRVSDPVQISILARLSAEGESHMMSESSTSSDGSTRRKSYPSDVTNRQWEQIDLLLPADAERGRNREYALREIVNAINYRWMTGCSWRMLPHDLPHWQTVYNYFRRWRREGLLSPLREILISRSLRIRRPAERTSRSRERRVERSSMVGPASRPLQVTTISDRNTSSWLPQSSCSCSRS